MTRWEPTPADLLAAARAVADRRAGWGASWPRVTAALTRQALEDAVRRLWTADEADMADQTMTDQLVCLPWSRRRLEPDVARQVRYAWSALSQACHAHAYELSPTTAELHRWIDQVDALVAAVERAA